MNTQNYNVNLRVGVGIAPKVRMSQGDVGRELAFNIYDGVARFSPPSSAVVKIKGTKPSGLGFNVACVLSGNVASALTTLDMTQESGAFPVELEISNGNTVIGTANFAFYIEPSPHPDGTTDGTHATVDNLQTQIGNLANLTTTAKTNLVSAINEAAQSGGTEVVIDNTLTQTGQAADAKKTGDEISAIKADLGDLDERVEALEEDGSGGSGLTDVIKTALMNLVTHIGAWTDENAQTYINDLNDALYPPAELVSISATYVQSGTVLDTDSLDSLKSDLTVTALYDNGTTQTITTYTLSGTLAKGTSTVTVTYGGKTTTFNVTVKGTGLPDEYQQVEWITNYGTFSQAEAKPTITLPLDDVLEIQFDMVSSGGGGAAFTSNIPNTTIAFYNGGIYYDLNNARAGFLALTANAVNTVRLGNHFVKSVELGTEKTNTTQTGLGEVTWQIYSNWTQQAQHIKYIKQYHEETLVKHYVPCYLKATERTGYYDVVNEEFIHGDKNQEVGDDV